MDHPNKTFDAFSQSLKERLEHEIKESESSMLKNKETLSKIYDLSSLHAKKLQNEIRNDSEKIKEMLDKLAQLTNSQIKQNPQFWVQQLSEYFYDMSQRQVRFFDTLRKRGNLYLKHIEAGLPPVLDFKYEIILDGHDMSPEVNYMLLKIIPPENIVIDETRAPIIIIDPRAGHGAGIGGFKPESQVGDGFADGHQVYFVAFRQMPIPTQTLADVRDAEIKFVQEVINRHPNAPKPIMIGNCQGGWATMLVAASAPQLLGPIVLNGAPLSYWAGKRGDNPMRYTGGMVGGAMPALLLADLGNGIFDGAALVENFEKLNPANTLFSKLYSLYSKIDSEPERFLEFERWWGGYCCMTEAEIRWIVENLFVGNKLTSGEAVLGYERVDLRRIESPIIVFASYGDNITPPQQALHWIPDLYTSVDELKALGQRIVYMLHESIGHLGIFVSAKIAGREHEAITDTFRAIEALSPGLYEMVVTDEADRRHIRFEPREMEDILHIGDGQDDEELFSEVNKLSEITTELYERLMRPTIKKMVTNESAELMRNMHPLRVERMMYSDKNPLLPMFDQFVQKQLENTRQPVSQDNVFLGMEKVMASMIEAQLNLYRSARDGLTEMAFFGMYSSPMMKSLLTPVSPAFHRHKDIDVRQMPEIRKALAMVETGGVPEATIRMLHLLTKARGYVRRTRLERELQALHKNLFPDLAHEEKLTDMIHMQSLIVDFEPKLSVDSLNILLDTPEKQKEALELVMEIAGPRDTMHPNALKQYQEFEKMFDLSTGKSGRKRSSKPAK